MSEIVTMPQLGETVTEGTILRWLVQVGDDVKEDEMKRKLQAAGMKAGEDAKRPLSPPQTFTL